MILKQKIYNRNEARYTTVNAGIKEWFRYPHRPTVLNKPSLGMCRAVGSEPRYNATAQVSSTQYDDGTYDLSIMLRCKVFYNGTEIKLWNTEFYTDGESLEHCYSTLQAQLEAHLDEMHLRQSVVENTFKDLHYGGLLV